MGVKILQVSNECKNIIGVKWELKNNRFQMSVEIFLVLDGCKNIQMSNGCKNILGVKWAKKKIQVLNGCKNILGAM